MIVRKSVVGIDFDMIAAVPNRPGWKPDPGMLDEIENAVDDWCDRVDAWIRGDLDYTAVWPIFRTRTRV